VREALQRLDPLWDELFPAEKERIVRLLGGVVVSKDGLLTRLRLNGLNSLVAELQGDAVAEPDSATTLSNDGKRPSSAPGPAERRPPWGRSRRNPLT
jgi:hypothetical protein